MKETLPEFHNKTEDTAMADLEQDELEEEMDRREFRRRRRVRNQIISYAVSGVLLLLLIGGAVFGIQSLIRVMNDRKEAEELQAQLEELAEAEEEVVVEAPQEATPEPVEEIDPLDEIVEGSISEMPLEDKVAGLFLITPEALTGADVATKAGDATKENLGQYAVGGLVYSKQNMTSEEQLKEMLSTTQSYSKYALFYAVEEEGGENSALEQAGLAEHVESMSTIGETGDAQQAGAAGSTIAGYLSDYGFNLDLAPVADVMQEGNTTIGERSFGSDGTAVASMVSAFVESMENGGISACLKHFPGLASTTEDAAAGMAATEKTLEEFQSTDFLAFQAGIEAGADFVMVSHLSVPGITGDNTPSSLSSQVVTDILRNQLGFEGVIITDSMSMAAITDYYTADEAAVKALLAGADMIYMPEDFQTAYNGVLEAVNNGTLTEERINESLRRIYRVKCRGRVAE